MKAEDLMIGDWVYLINTVHNVSFPDNGVIQDEGYTTTHTPIKITTVSENCVSYYSNKLELYITVSSEDIEPIPLTPEILEKNGILYEKQSYYYVIEDNKDLECTYYIQQVQDDWAIGVDIGAYDCSVFARIKYVHELQHALKLCGINKEILV
jgi:hypothetical protein